VPGLGYKFVSDAGKFSGRRRTPPCGWKVIDYDHLGRQIVGKFRSDQDQIRRRVVRVEPDERGTEHGRGVEPDEGCTRRGGPDAGGHAGVEGGVRRVEDAAPEDDLDRLLGALSP